MQTVLSSTIMGLFFGTMIAFASMFYGAPLILASYIYLGSGLSAMALSTAVLILRRRRDDQGPNLAAA